jgi:uncharacterized membrane protein YhhN
MKKLALVLFILSALGVLAAGLLSIQWLYFASKPFIMISLFAYYLVSAEPVNRSRALLLAMVLSLAGDVLLMWEEYFLSGLVAFLIAHVLYSFAYRQHQHEETENTLAGLQRVRLAFPIILGGTGLIVVLYPVLGHMRLPVIVYAAVLMLMAVNALFRHGRTSPASFWMVFGGAVLFMISDSVLAVNRFLTPLTHATTYIMLTYTLAQFLIVKGLLRHPHP